MHLVGRVARVVLAFVALLGLFETARGAPRVAQELSSTSLLGTALAFLLAVAFACLAAGPDRVQRVARAVSRTPTTKVERQRQLAGSRERLADLYQEGLALQAQLQLVRSQWTEGNFPGQAQLQMERRVRQWASDVRDGLIPLNEETALRWDNGSALPGAHPTLSLIEPATDSTGLENHLTGRLWVLTHLLGLDVPQQLASGDVEPTGNLDDRGDPQVS